MKKKQKNLTGKTLLSIYNQGRVEGFWLSKIFLDLIENNCADKRIINQAKRIFSDELSYLGRHVDGGGREFESHIEKKISEDDFVTDYEIAFSS